MPPDFAFSVVPLPVLYVARCEPFVAVDFTRHDLPATTTSTRSPAHCMAGAGLDLGV